LIWSLLCFELWCRVFLEGRGLEAPPNQQTGVERV
jgi:hypothetical protein